MNGVFGALDVALESPDSTIAALAGGSVDSLARPCFVGAAHALGAAGSPTTRALVIRDGRAVALHGHPFWSSGSHRVTSIHDVANCFLDAFATKQRDALATLHGDYALALVEPGRHYAFLAVDRMAVRNIVYASSGRGLAFGPTADALAAVTGFAREIDPQQLFNYLYFHMIPGTSTVYRGSRRVPPGHCVEFERGALGIHAHWRPVFQETSSRDLASLAREFRATIADGVRIAVDGARSGAFLSGGTDSSTITGFLREASGAPPQTYSIGFQAPGYDEMAYARTAARHFGAVQHEYYVTPQDVVDAVPRIAQAYDQPFGNASAVPTYYCARLAQQSGIERLLGGDGGDELFGGNARYAKQIQFARYGAIPGSLRTLLESFSERWLPRERGWLLRKTRSYITQASLPMPDRYESYNILERLGVDTVCDADFLAGVDRLGPISELRDTWAATSGASLINRMLALDFKVTLADNDLPKVTRMCELAGVDVAFPMLHDPLIDFSLTLPPRYKLRGTSLRWFFKRALADFLPHEVIAKEKHGFGLPVGLWLRERGPLRDLAGDSLASLKQRRIVRADFIDRLFDHLLDEHAGFYGTMVWVLMMLELWFRRTSPLAQSSRIAS